MRIALIGLGEVGRVLAEHLTAHDPSSSVAAWDVAFEDLGSRAAGNARDLPVRAAADAADAVSGADLVLSAVTAANDLTAATAVAAVIARGCWFVDLNSASPGQKQRCAEVIEAARGRYVEAAVMSPIHPRRAAAPILLGGPHADDFAGVAAALGFTGAVVFASVVGPASATKLSRSVVVKGLEALLTESLLTARAWGVEADVLRSLSDLVPAADWPALAEYMIRRSIEHGGRRAEEMYEAAATVADAGVEPLMATATAHRQEWAGGQAAALQATDLPRLLDAIRKATT
jgi:3-hydroxyisobutyrate dehydrogenase-like beta-hydroxyacid dehydrogenase